MIRIGNDVVDLREPRSEGKASDERFVARVFTPEEAAAIRDDPSPDRALWVRWAAKEAAFKVVSKLLGSPPPFEHAAFRVALDGDGDPDRSLSGRVRYRDTDVDVTVEAAAERVHVLALHREPGAPEAPVHREVVAVDDAALDPSAAWRDEVRVRFTDREWGDVHGPASARIRLRAREHLGRVLGVAEGDLEIVCDEGPPGRSPPRILIGGEEHPADLTLSHHGRFLAWAFTDPAPDGRSGSDSP